MKTVRWVQQDWVRASGSEPAVYVLDPQTVGNYSLKRLVFVYECLLELNVEIRRGAYEEELMAFCREQDANILVTTATPDPRARQAIERLQRAMTVLIEEPEPLVTPGQALDLKRFSRYWARVEPLLLPPEARKR